MHVIRDPAQFPFLGNAVVTSGTFDGVHVGHQRILTRLREVAQASGGPSVVITYWPHPRLVLGPPPSHPELLDLQLLNTLDERIAKLAERGVDYLLIVPFTREFAQWTSEEYIQNLLLKTVGAKQLVIGYDHRFGKNREGGFDYLSQNADRYGLTVEEIPREDVDAVGVSSTRIRQALRQGDIATANRYLGYYYPLTGLVEHGQKLGRTIGYPTANLAIPEPLKLVPARGIYAVWATTAAGTRHQAMLSIGVRPTIGTDLAQTIEVNLLDFSGDLYDQLLTLEFVAWLRGEEKYDGLDALTTQLALDAQNTRAALAASTEKAIYRAIDEILWNDWDPIGVNDIAPRDEYQMYTPEIFSLKTTGATADVIAKRLHELEQIRMGLSGNIEHCKEVAQKIIDL
ncbi:riboflavin kinase/FMN adenylyltransferase [Hymenobacter sp. UYAg731]